MKYDLAIIGAGPGGYNAAENAAKNGLYVVLFEKENIGGVCLNEGCVPTKTLLYSAKQLDQAKASNKYGITIEGEVTFDLDKTVKRKNKIVRKLVAGINAGLKNNDVTIVKGEASFLDHSTDGVFILCNDEHYFAKNVIIATGSSTFIPPIEGLEKTNYWTSKEALSITELPKRLTIIGGGVIGIEFASYFASLGVLVHVVEAMEGILINMDRELVAMLQTELTKKGIQFHLNAKVTEVNENEVILDTANGTVTLPTDQILVSVGRKPKLESLKLANVKVNVQHGAISVDEHLITSNPRIYAIGDVTGKMMLAHTAIRAGEVAINHILQKDDKMEYNTIPAVVYTNPELAATGASEKELISKKIQYKSIQIPMTYSGRFVAENELGNGICKVFTDNEGIILGCHILGNPASEIISLATIAIQDKKSISEFRKYIIPHPTVAEILHEAVMK